MSLRTIGGIGSQDSRHPGPQEGRVMGSRIPDNRPIHAEIGMNGDVPETHDIGPLHFEMLLFKAPRQTRRRLADQYQFLQYGTLQHFVLEKFIPVDAKEEALDSLRGFKDISQILGFTPHTRSRRWRNSWTSTLYLIY